MKANHLLSPLRESSYRSFFSSQLLSDLGNWFDFTILTVLIAYQWGLKEEAMAAFIITYGLPWVIIGPFANVFVDRLPKKMVLITTLMLRSLLILSYLFAPSFIALLFLVFLKGTVASLFDPAKQASIRALVSERHLSQAVTLTQISSNTTKIIGPSLSGLLVHSFSVSTALKIESALFLLAILPLLTFRIPEFSSHHQLKEKASYMNELRAGFRQLRQSTLVLTALIASSISLFIVFLYDGLLVFVSKELQFDESFFGLLISSVGLGSVVGALALGHLRFWQQKPITTMAVSFLGIGSFIILLGLGASNLITLHAYIWFIGAFLCGAISRGEHLPYAYLLQRDTPADKMARVSSVAQSIQITMMLLAPSIGAILAKHLGVGTVFMIAGCLCFLTSIGVWSFLKTKKLESPAGNVNFHETM
ncbi:MFS transporter [Priestia koreensis]|uniref:MFS transporter n=1 Tax=Priestia koreensis TaxID=284581 RepID=UPI00203D2963|nr:MFS transporter [Priestia koreensis]MCM3004967.1 MFS transporter [Priestia koreensis]